ncbi:hypothetical protein SAMN05192563_1024168 [Paraburkholderia aspalathi]|uniref:Tyr recombinase domain-containing protein n=1 Tax=Paraburkholderia aspalathi TaxID=1324617 RepID=A0A1I7EJI6_9BURK|nr:hypothetical protein SAMN05192563_1024168 [Paraburkholderia aspalathi]
MLLTMLYNTGMSGSEIIGIRVVDLFLDDAACVHLRGKGRKLRSGFSISRLLLFQRTRRARNE